MVGFRRKNGLPLVDRGAGFEPTLAGSEPAFLPLEDPRIFMATPGGIEPPLSGRQPVFLPLEDGALLFVLFTEHHLRMPHQRCPGAFDMLAASLVVDPETAFLAEALLTEVLLPSAELGLGSGLRRVDVAVALSYTDSRQDDNHNRKHECEITGHRWVPPLIWRPKMELNHRREALQTSALPLSYRGNLVGWSGYQPLCGAFLPSARLPFVASRSRASAANPGIMSIP